MSDVKTLLESYCDLALHWVQQEAEVKKLFLPSTKFLFWPLVEALCIDCPVCKVWTNSEIIYGLI